ncbi:GNAT family N-acetyltransferase [Oceaniglobus trochenteri]|uniref:GNAT family N-acetyltransferase n=1 Tax=Oceaniglobus trochenteri TaxID=2763260 RepID=UPI001CFFB221|nr:GNAT family N-acetyltransferase [Oceaniglobus trochenteri]
MSDPEIRRETGTTRGRYVLEQDGAEAELTYSIVAPDHIIADHTGVPHAFRGQGIAAKLVARLVSDAQAEGVKITSRCSYVTAQARRHPEWADVFTG